MFFPGLNLGSMVLISNSLRIFKSKFIQGVIDLYFALQKNDEALAVHAYEQWGFENITKEILSI